MLSEELLKKVKRIEITTKKLVDDLLSGDYRTHFKGHGVQFSEHRTYAAGDDIRHIDWKVSARSRELLIKKFEEERELTVLLIVDLSGSQYFGSQKKLKSELVAEIGGMLAYAASHTGDKVGVLLFSEEVEKIIPPKKGKSHVLRVIRDLLAFHPQKKGTDMNAALEVANRVMRHSGIVFILSDFIVQNYQISLKKLARRHDVVGLCLRDPREMELPQGATLLLENAETGEQSYVKTHSWAFRRWLEDYQKRQTAQVEQNLKSAQVELVLLKSDEDPIEPLIAYFKRRRTRK